MSGIAVYPIHQQSENTIHKPKAAPYCEAALIFVTRNSDIESRLIPWQ